MWDRTDQMSEKARFDGWVFSAVRTTGIYCRPSCPASPKPENVTYYPTAAAAQVAGYRACKRCRPDATPGSPEWDRRDDLIGRAMRLIADGVVDREGVGGLARRLGYSERHVHRALADAVGAGPLALARAQRAQTARILLETTALPAIDIATAAGFASVRQFNATIREVFALTPTEIRAKKRGQTPILQLPVRAPFAGDALLEFLRRRLVPGVEEVVDGAYVRSLRLPHGNGVVELRPAADHVAAQLWLDDLRDTAAAVARSRALLDLDADPEAVDAALGDDRLLGPLVRSCPGRRVPGAVDGDELAVRAVLGQQISLAGAATLAARLTAAHGEPLARPLGGVTHSFPTADALAAADPDRWPLPRSRRRALAALSTALARRDVSLDGGAEREVARGRLAALPGIGRWTVEYIAMRALRDPDAFPSSDLGVRHALERLGEDGRAAAAERAAAPWRPYRAYAVQHLWASLAATATRTETSPTPERLAA